MLCPNCGVAHVSYDKVGLCEECEAAEIFSRIESGPSEDLSSSSGRLSVNPLTVNRLTATRRSSVKLEAYLESKTKEDLGNLEEEAIAEVAVGGFWLRVGARLIDSAIIGLVCLVAHKFITFNAKKFIAVFLNKYILLNLPVAWKMMIVFAVPALISFLYLFMISSAIGLLYFPIFEASRLGATPGKFILGLRVVDSEEQSISFIRAFIRAFVRQIIRYLNFFFLGFGYLMALFTESTQAAHDYFTETYVVKFKIVNSFVAFICGLVALLIIIWIHNEGSNYSRRTGARVKNSASVVVNSEPIRSLNEVPQESDTSSEESSNSEELSAIDLQEEDRKNLEYTEEEVPEVELSDFDRRLKELNEQKQKKQPQMKKLQQKKTQQKKRK